MTNTTDALKMVRQSLIQRCVVAVEMANSHKEALERLQTIQAEIDEE